MSGAEDDFWGRQLEDIGRVASVKHYDGLVDKVNAIKSIAQMPIIDPAPIVINASRGFRCLNLGCPERPAARSTEAPICYTCARPMAEVHASVTEAEIAKLKDDHPWGEPATWRRAKRLHDALVRPDVKVTPRAEIEQAVRRQIDPKRVTVSFGGIPITGFMDGTLVEDHAPKPSRYSAEQKPICYKRAYRCTSPGCPERAPIRAASPPTCYTCSQPMAVAQWALEFGPVDMHMHGDVGKTIDAIKHRLAQDLAVPATFFDHQTCERKWFFKADELPPWQPAPRPRGHMLGIGETMNRRTVRFDGRTIHNCDVLPCGTWDGPTWLVVVKRDDEERSAFAALHALWDERRVSALYSDADKLAEHAVMEEFRVDHEGPGGWKVTGRFRQVRTPLQKTP